MKKYYIVDKIDEGKINHRIKTVEALEDENGQKRYLEDGKEYYIAKFREFCFENEEDARNKIADILQNKQDKDLEDFTKKQTLEKQDFMEKQTLEKQDLFELIEIVKFVP